MIHSTLEIIGYNKLSHGKWPWASLSVEIETVDIHLASLVERPAWAGSENLVDLCDD